MPARRAVRRGAGSSTETWWHAGIACRQPDPTHTRVPPSGDASVEAADEAYGPALEILRAANGGKGFENIYCQLTDHTLAQIKEMDPAVVARLVAAQLKAAGESGGACGWRGVRLCSWHMRSYPQHTHTSSPPQVLQALPPAQTVEAARTARMALACLARSEERLAVSGS
jgi:hypothetical protein